MNPPQKLKSAPWRLVPPAAMARMVELFNVELQPDGRLPSHAQVQIDPDGRQATLVTLDRGSTLVSYAVGPDALRSIGTLLTAPALRPVTTSDVQRISWRPKPGRAA